jgi:hypothetical protein
VNDGVNHLMSGTPLSHLGFVGDSDGNGVDKNDVTDSEDSHTYHNHYIAKRRRGRDGRGRGRGRGDRYGDDYDSRGGRGGRNRATHSHTVLGTPSCYLLDDILDKQMTLSYRTKLTIYFYTKCKKRCEGESERKR